MSEEYDVVVVGSGAAGLTAAITAKKNGLSVVVLEKEPWFGGTTAQSGGYIWIPGNHQAVALGLHDSLEAARNYVRNLAGEYVDESMLDAFLETGSSMLQFLERETEVRFKLNPTRPDYHPDVPGGVAGGRSLGPVDFDGRALGTAFQTMRHPLSQISFFGMFLGSAGEIEHYFNFTRSARSAWFVARQLVRHTRDLILYRRGARLTRGGALIARLAKSALDLEIPIRVSCPVVRVVEMDGRVGAVEIYAPAEKSRTIAATRAVILASGGFPRDTVRRASCYAHLRDGCGDATITPSGNTGDGIRLAESVGGLFQQTVSNPAAWIPLSIIPGRLDQAAAFPHLTDRNKPGFIAVTRRGERFVNEAGSYHTFVQAMFRACRDDKEIAVFLLCDHRTISRYGLGFAKPFPVPRWHHIRSGYLVRAKTLAELAGQIGVDAAGLKRTVSQFNEHAERGSDPQFRRGENAYDRYQGDAKHMPNPSLGPIKHAPFYAVKLVAGDIATLAGLKTDTNARVLDKSGNPIPGLYAAGNDMLSVMGGSYPGAGMTLGPAMTFGYIAALHAAGKR